jgi:hypothetical protein
LPLFPDPPYQVDISAGADRPLLQVRQVVPWRRQFAVLLARTLREQSRRTGVVATQVGQALVLAVLIGTVFLQVRLKEEGWGLGGWGLV